ncbi:hypothetical protein OIU78_007531 [Salix suchowensis]|nr:hypothetical protein OIU78_007531 [Salix suchowensis]
MEALCAAPFMEEKANLRDVEAEILAKRTEMSEFETEYREVLAQFAKMTSRYAQEMQAVSLSKLVADIFVDKLMVSDITPLILVLQIDELLRQRVEIHASSHTTAPPTKRSSSKSRNKGSIRETIQVRDKKPSTTRDGPKKKIWFNIHLKVDRRKPC